MITTALIVAGALLSVAAVIVFVLSLAYAPEGREDESGFHLVEEPGTVHGCYYCAKSEAPRSLKTAKAFKAHIPAA